MSTVNGISTMRSRHPVNETVERLKNLLEARHVRLFALIDHSGEAEKAGMKMPNTKLLIFGSPAAGTPVMLAAPSAAIDLPLKILAWEDARGDAWLSWNSAEYLRGRHNLPMELEMVLSAAGMLAERAAE